MSNFPRLQALAAFVNSINFNDAMSVYLQREIDADVQCVIGLSNMWDVLYNRVSEMKMLSSELNLLGGPLSVQCGEFLKELIKT